ncbi:hypothetical protein GGR58DRAFT_516207 [Xylaria digitata]|nr:hypothetical protein GGR58DRAFT_516207 [Xylaria digitata]
MQDALETTTVGWLTIILGWVLTALALLSVLLYIWSRKVREASMCSFDDILIYLSFLLSLALMSLTTWAVVVEGQGRHQSAESRSQFDPVAKSLLINEIIWGIVNTFLRIGAILFIRRVFSSKDERSVIGGLGGVTVILLVVSVAYAIAVIATSLAICQPISAGWDSTVIGRCGNEVVAYLSLEIISAILDLAIVIAPLPRLMGLKMALSKKWRICVLFSLGSVVFIITGLRIAALNRVNSRLLSILGPLIAIICCCTTACAGTVIQHFPRWPKYRAFSERNVIWSIISTRRSRWWPSTATKNNQETEFEGVISRPELHESVSTLEILFETRGTDTTTQVPIRS